MAKSKIKFSSALPQIIGDSDDYRWYNPKSGRPIKKPDDYDEIVLYSENDRMGYKGLTWLKKTSDGFIKRKEIFDQGGEFNSFNELWDAFGYMDFQDEEL